MGDSGVEILDQPAPAEDIRNDDELQCTICLSPRFAQECRVDGCNHSFCFSCISEWVCQSLRPSCPMCRQEVDKVSYDFSEDKNGLKQIDIKEYRSGHMSLTPTDRTQLLSERRLVVRNLMYAYKVVGCLSSNITDIEESKEPDEVLKAAMIEMAEIVKLHIQKAESSLCELRTEIARKNKSVVFNTLTFRRMIYTVKIKIRYPDQKRPKLQPSDISKQPERFRSIITNFLISEFDAIPFQPQPVLAGHQWRTNFFGANINLEEKQRYAAQIYQLMMTIATGNGFFQKQLGDILTTVSRPHIQLLDDHLDAIIAIEKSTIEEFYNEVYYDTVYNSLSNSFFDYNSMMTMRDDPTSRFEAIFQHLSRGLPANEWMDPYLANRLFRQSSNTDGTDRATNNDDDEDGSNRSASPEERVPTPMPDIFHNEEEFQEEADELRQQLQQLYDFERELGIIPPRPIEFRPPTMPGNGQTTRTLPFMHQSEAVRGHMTLRSSVRRERERQAEMGPSVETRPLTRREVDRRLLTQRTRDFENQSEGISRMFQTRHPANPSLPSRFSAAPLNEPFRSSAVSSRIPVYTPSAASLQAIRANNWDAVPQFPTESSPQFPAPPPRRARIPGTLPQSFFLRDRTSQRPHAPPEYDTPEERLATLLNPPLPVISLSPGGSPEGGNEWMNDPSSRGFRLVYPDYRPETSSASSSASSSEPVPAPAPIPFPTDAVSNESDSETAPVAQRTRSARRARNVEGGPAPKRTSNRHR